MHHKVSLPLKRALTSSLKRSQGLNLFFSSNSSNFDELIVQLESARNVETIQSLVNRALDYESPNIHATAFESALIASFKLKDHIESFRLFSEMQKRDLSPSAHAFSYAARSLAVGNQWNQAADVVRTAWESNINVDPKTITEVLAACQHASDEGAEERAEICCEFLDRTPPNLRSPKMVRLAIKCVSQCGTWKAGYDLLKKLQDDHADEEGGAELLGLSYTFLMNYCVEHREPEKSLDLFQELGASDYPLNVWSFDIAMRAALGLHRASFALKLFQQLEPNGITPNVAVARRALRAAQILQTSECNEMLLPYLLDRSRPDLTIAALTGLCKLYIKDEQPEDALLILDNLMLAAIPQYDRAVPPDYQWCDDEWAQDRVPVLCDHSLEVLGALKDLDRCLALIRTVGAEFIHPKVADKIGQLWHQAEADLHLHVIQECLEIGLEPTSKSHSYAIAACYKEKRWHDVVELYSNIKHLPLSTVALNSVIVALGHLGDWEAAIQLLTVISEREDLSVDVRTYNAALSACARCARWKEARDLLRVLKASTLKPDVHSFIHTMLACRLAERYVATMEVFSEMKKAGFPPSVEAYNIALAAAAARNMSQKAEAIFVEMRERSVRPNIITYNTLVRALAKGGEMRKALGVVIQAMPEDRVPLDRRSMEAIFTTFSNSEAVCNSVGLMEHWLNQIDPNLKLELKASTVRSHWIDDKDWKQLLGMVNKMVAKDRKKLSNLPDKFAFGGAVRACEKVEWMSLDQEIERGEFQGGLSARLLVDTMTTRFQLKAGRIILGVCLDACLKQLQNDRYQKKNADSQEELLESAIRTIEQLKQLEDFDPVAVQKQLIKAVAGGVQEVAPILNEFNNMVQEFQK